MSFRAVITFHSIDEARGPLSYPPQRLDALLSALDHAGLSVVDLDSLLVSPAKPGVSLTFDDGMRSVFSAALPVLRDHGARAHLFLATGSVADGATHPGAFEMLDWNELGELHRAGVAIESHTHSHRDCRTLSDAEIDHECASADALIERRIGRRPRYFAYPFGRHDARVCERVGRRYAAAFTTVLGPLPAELDRARLPRLDAHYLRSPRIYERLDAATTRAYLEIRRMLRVVRGTD